MTYLPHWPKTSTIGNRKINLETVFLRLAPILEKLGNPHHKLPPTIHITGTNGKGSTATFLSEIFKHSGYKTDLFTSPHIHNYNERIKINGQDISDRELYEIIEEIRHAAKDSPILLFETITIAAFLAFSRSNSDICILESGMGGRIDATNIIPNKIASIITKISLDHEEFLGDTVAKIAFDKSFIIAQSTPIITALQQKEAAQIIELIAKDRQAPLINFSTKINGNFDFKMKEIELKNLEKPTLRGNHQCENAATAIACALTLKQFNISENSIRKALKTAKIPNRIEKIDNFNKFFSKNTEIYIDSAHNNDGAKSLSHWINSKTGKKYLIIGFTKNKCRPEFIQSFKSITEIIAIRVNGEPNPESPEKITEIATSCRIKITKQDDLLDAIKYLSKKITEPAIITITGSIYLARDVKKYSK